MPLPSATSARAIDSSSLIVHLLVAASIPMERLYPRQFLRRRGDDPSGADPPRRMDLRPPVLRIPDARPDDGDASAGIGNRHDGAILRDHLDDERLAVVRPQPDVDVAVELLELHLRHDPGGDRARLLHLEARGMVDAGERRTLTAVRGGRRSGSRPRDEEQRGEHDDRGDERELQSGHATSVPRERPRRKCPEWPEGCAAVYPLPCRARTLLVSQRRFAHPAEAEYARLLDEHGIPWEYEPHTFRLETHEDGRIVEAMTPDFYLPTIGVYVECTTARRRLMSRKRRKTRKLRERYGAIVTLLERADLERLLGRTRARPDEA